MTQRYGEYVLSLENDGYVVLVFDPKHPPTPQLDEAAKILEQYRKEAIADEFDESEVDLLTPEEKADNDVIVGHKRTIAKPFNRLRVLDALNEDVTPLDIGTYIFKVEDSDDAEKIAKERIIIARNTWQHM